MKKLFSILLCAFCVAGLTGCATSNYPDTGSQRPVYRVSMPSRLNANEGRLIGEVEAALERNGLRPTNQGDGDYVLEFTVEDGPVNADATLTLYQRQSQVARGYARVGGPRIILQRQRVIREAFDAALRQFENELPRSGYGHDGYDRDGYGGNLPPPNSDGRGYYTPGPLFGQ